MTITLLDPTGERSVPHRERLPRPASFDGHVVALLDISKPRGDVFLDRIHELLNERGIEVRRYMKPTVARPAPVPLAQQIGAEVNLVIEGLAD